jgi:hypothetical protein
VHSVRLERLGEGLVVRSSEMASAHWVDELVAEASASGCLGVVPKCSVVAYGMENDVHASTGESYLGF